MPKFSVNPGKIGDNHFQRIATIHAFSFPMSIVWLSKLYSDDVFNDNESVQRLRVQDEERRKNAHRWISSKHCMDGSVL